MIHATQMNTRHANNQKKLYQASNGVINSLNYTSSILNFI